MDQINLNEVAERYNKLSTIWNEKDTWHMWTKRMISGFIQNFIKKNSGVNSNRILNAGSAGYSYGIDESKILHIDIASARISHLPNSIVADIHNIPVSEAQFNLIICVGSVINYCDPIVVFRELSRVLTKDGYLILEFENSHTLELIGKASFNSNATIVETFYNNSSEKIWYFSESYIKELALLYGFELEKYKRCHILSPLIYRLSGNEKFSSRFRKLDKICSYIPYLNRFSSNTILLFKRIVLIKT